MIRFAAPLLAGAAFAAAVPLAAQTGGITGTVTSRADGRPVAAATVLVPGTALVTDTDRNGRFRVASLPAGTWVLRVLAPGFEPAEVHQVTVSSGAMTEVNVALRPALIELPGVVVTASRSEGRAGEVPASVEVLQLDDVTARNAVTIEDALPFASGVTFNGGQMDIRGASGLALGVGSRVLMLLDGHRVLDGTTAEIDFDALPLLDIDRIEIVKGPSSALYGSNALGGVVNVITRRAPERPRTVVRGLVGTWDVPADVAFTSERLTVQGVDALHQRRIGAVGTSLFVGRKTSDGFKQNGEFSRWLVRGKVDVPVGGADWEVFGSFARDDHGNALTWRDNAAPFEVPPNELGDWLRSDKVTGGATLVPVAARNAVLRLRPQAHYTRVQNYFASDSNFHQATRLGSELQLTVTPHPSHALALGVDGFYTIVRSNFVGNPEVVDAAVYAQDEIALGKGWSLTLGARLDYHDVEGGTDEVTLNPKAGLVYRVTPAVALRASVGRGYRAPSATEQFVNTTLSGFRVIPNPALGGETGLAAEVGITATVARRLQVDAGVFHTDYDNLIEPSGVPGQLFTFQFQNVAEARITGLDLGAGLAVVEELVGVHATYTFLETRDTRLDEPLPYRSRHAATGTLTVGPAAVDVRYRSRVARVLAFPLDARGAITVVDLRAGYPVRPWLIVQGKVGNLFNDIYPDVQERRPAPPRSFVLTVTSAF